MYEEYFFEVNEILEKIVGLDDKFNLPDKEYFIKKLAKFNICLIKRNKESTLELHSIITIYLREHIIFYLQFSLIYLLEKIFKSLSKGKEIENKMKTLRNSLYETRVNPLLKNTFDVYEDTCNSILLRQKAFMKIKTEKKLKQEIFKEFYKVYENKEGLIYSILENDEVKQKFYPNFK